VERRILLSQISFQLNARYSLGTAPGCVVAADVNRDGKRDALLTEPGANAIGVTLGDGHGGFGSVSTFTVGASPKWLATGDFNADGKVDLVTANGADNTVSVLIGNGSGSFAASTVSGASRDYAVGASPQYVLVADFNADGKLDIATANNGGQGSSLPILSVLLGNGNGTFQTAWNSTLGGQTWDMSSTLAVADFNGDGKPDLAIGNPSADYVTIATGNGDGTFTFASRVTPNDSLSSPNGTGAGGSVASADLNGDGKADLVIAGTQSASVTPVDVWFGNGDGTFGSESVYYAGGGPASISIADLNADGKPDIAVTNFGSTAESSGAGRSGGVSILLNDGTGHFAGSITYASGAGATSVALADFNQDGTPDLLVADQADNSLTLDAAVGDGTFVAPRDVLVQPPTNGSNPPTLVGGPQQFSTSRDFNHDGIKDLAVVENSAGGSGYVSVLTVSSDGQFSGVTRNATGGDPRGLVVGGFGAATINAADDTISVLGSWTATTGFQTRTDYSTGGPATAIALGDVNGDGLNDLVVSRWDTNLVEVFLNNGDGTFAPYVSFTDAGAQSSLAVADLNGDGSADIVTTSAETDSIGVLLNAGVHPGSGWQGFASPVIYPNAGHPAPSSVIIADLNGDNRLDIATRNGWGNDTPDIGLWLGNGDSTFASPTYYGGIAGAAGSLTSADVDGSGLPDLISADAGNQTVSILLNRGPSGGVWQGFSTTPVSISIGTTVSAVATGNFNGDGLLDLITANSLSDNFSVVLQDQLPTASAGGPYTVAEQGSTTLTASASDADDGSLHYEWDFQYDGTTFHSMADGRSVTLNAAAISGITSGAVAVRVTDLAGASTIATASLNVVADAPVVTGGLTLNADAGVTSQPQTVATFVDPDGAEATSNYSALIDFGDGSTPVNGSISYNASTQTFSVIAQHNYAVSGSYAISVTVSRGAVSSAPVSSLAAVSGPFALTGDAGADTFYLRAYNGNLQAFVNMPAPAPGDAGQPTRSVPLSLVGLVSVSGLAGDDTLTIDYTGGDPLRHGLSFDGGTHTATGSNHIVIVGTGSNDALSLTGSVLQLGSSSPISYISAQSFGLMEGGSSTGNSLSISGGTFTFAQDLGSSAASLSVTVAGTANVSFAISQRLQSLGIDSGGMVTMSPLGGQVLDVDHLRVDGDLDLTDNDLAVNTPSSGEISSLQTELVAGITLGSYSPPLPAARIFTSTGHVDNRTLGLIAPITGSMDVDDQIAPTGALVARYTLFGDTNLDGIVNINDLANLAGNYGMTAGGTWLRGDFDYNGTINVADLADLSGNFGQYALGQPKNAQVGTPFTAQPDSSSTFLPTSVTINGQSHSVVRWDIDWGDGDFDSFALGASSVSATHSYTSSGSAFVLMTAVTSDGVVLHEKAVPVAISASGTWHTVSLTGTASDTFKLVRTGDRTNDSAASVQVFKNGSLLETDALSGLLSLTIGGTSSSAAVGTLTLDFSGGTPLPLSGLSFNGKTLQITGGTGSDTLLTTATAAIFNNAVIRYAAGTAIKFLDAGPGDWVVATAGTVTIPADDPGASTTAGPNILVATGATVLFDGSQRISALKIAPAGTARVVAAGNSAIVADSLEIDDATDTYAGGVLDLADNDLVIRHHTGDGDVMGRVTTLLNAGFAGGAWDGSSTAALSPAAIVSSVAHNDRASIEALASGQFTQAVSNFDGVAMNVGDIVIRFTYYDDDNLDGGADHTPPANQPMQGPWESGDVNYDGVVDDSDAQLVQHANATVANSFLPTAPLVIGVGMPLPSDELPSATPDGIQIDHWIADWGNNTTSTIQWPVLPTPYSSGPGVYSVVFRAMSSTGDTLYIYPRITVNVVVAPPAPTNVTAVPISATEVFVGWVDSSGQATSYTIERSNAVGDLFTTIQTVSNAGHGTTMFLDTGLVTGSSYYYRVHANNVAGSSSDVAAASPAVPATGPTDATGAYAVAAIGTVQGSSNVTSLLFISNPNRVVGGSPQGAILQGISGTLTVTISGVTRQYDVGLSAAIRPAMRGGSPGLEFDANYGVSGDTLTYSDFIPISVVADSKPLAPGTPSATAVSSSEIDITWPASPDAIDGYNVYRLFPGGWQLLNPHGTPTVGPGVTEFHDISSFDPNTPYDYCVKAVRHGVESLSSNAVQVTSLPPPLTNASIEQVFDSVYNSIQVELYAGALKGPTATADTSRGNDWDQAALLIQKLAGIAPGAQFAWGQIQTSIDSVRQWLGMPAANVLSDANVIDLLRVAGLNPQPSGTNEVIFDHAWVQMPSPSGGPDLFLDPSWKQTAQAPSMPTSANVGAMIDGVLTNPDRDLNFLSGTSTPFDYYEGQLSNWLTAHAPGVGLADLSLRGPIIPQAHSTLPTAPPYIVIGTPSTAARVPVNMTDRVLMSITQAGNPNAHVFPDAQYATEDFLSNVVSFSLTAVNGQYERFVDNLIGTSTAPASVEVSSITPSAVTLTITHFDAGYDPAHPDASKVHSYQYQRYQGDLFTVGINADQVTDTALSKQQSQMNAMAAKRFYGVDLDDISSDALERKFLALSELTYFRDVNEQRDLLANQLHTLPVWAHAESGIMIGDGGPAQVWSKRADEAVIPTRTHTDNQNVANGDSVVLVPIDQSTQARSNVITQLIAADASSLEGQSIESLSNKYAISTAKAFQWAIQQKNHLTQAQSTLHSATDVDGLASSLPLTTNQANALKAVFSEAGHTIVLAPAHLHIQNSVHYFGQWSGIAWVDEKVINGQVVSERYALMSDKAAVPEFGGDSSNQKDDVQAQPPQKPVNPWDSFGDPFNAANGEATRDESDFTVSYVMPVTFTRHYSSWVDFTLGSNLGTDRMLDTGMGTGWTFTFGDFLYFNKTRGPGGTPVTDEIWWNAGDGSRRVFRPDPEDINRFISTDGDGGTLTRDLSHPTTLVYLATDGSVYRFETLMTGKPAPEDYYWANLQSITDRNGNQLICVYNNQNQLWHVDAKPVGGAQVQLLLFAYTDPNGLVPNHIQSVTAVPANETWTFDYNDHPDPDSLNPNNTDPILQHRYYLTAVHAPLVQVDPLNSAQQQRTVSYTYFNQTDDTIGDVNLQGLLRSVTEVNGGVRTYEYYQNRRVFGVTDGDGPSEREQYASYNLIDHQTRTDDPDGNATVTTYSVEGHALSTRLPDGSTSSQRWAGQDYIGVYRPGTGFFVDNNDNNAWNQVTDASYGYAGGAGAVPVVGDWNGDGQTDLGFFAGDTFTLDGTGTHNLVAPTHITFAGYLTGDIPIVGDFNGDGRDEMGIFRDSGGVDMFIEDKNGDHTFSTTVTFSGAGQYQLGDQPVIGDWNGDGKWDVGIMRVVGNVCRFYLDDGGTTESFDFGAVVAPGSIVKPLSGFFSGDSISDVGVFEQQPGKKPWFILDSNANHRADVTSTDNTDFDFSSTQFGTAGDLPVIGNWTRNGNRGQLLSTTDELGRIQRFTYDTAGNVTSQIAKDGLTTDTQYASIYYSDRSLGTYEKAGVITIKGRGAVLDRVTKFEYDEHGNLEWTIDAENNATYMHYDGDGRVMLQVKPNGTTVDTNGTPHLNTNPMSPGSSQSVADEFSTNFTYWNGVPTGSTATGQETDLVQQQSTIYGQTNNVYDALGHLTSTNDGTTADDGTARVTTQRFNALGELLSITYAGDMTPGDLLPSVKNHYENGLLISTTDARGNQTQFEYDSLGRQYGIVFPPSATSSGPTQLTQYDGVGNVIATTDELGHVTQYFYERRNRRIETLYPDGTVTRVVYDAAGRVVATIDQLGHATLTQYDAADRKSKEIGPKPGGPGDPIAPETDYVYNDLGLRTQTILDGNTSPPTTTFFRDMLGRVYETISPGNIISTMAYDGDGNQINSIAYDTTTYTSTTAPLSTLPAHITVFTFDGLDRKTAEIDSNHADGSPTGPATGYEYDPSGNLITTTDPLKNETATEYDARNRVVATGQELRTGATLSLENDGITIDVTLTNHGLTQSDADEVLLRTSVPGPWNGAHTVTVTGSDTFRFTMSRAWTGSLPVSSADVFLVAVSNTYDPAGNVHTQTNARGVTTTFDYDDRNRKIKETDQDPDTSDSVGPPITIWNYDDAGNLTSVIDPRGSDNTSSPDLHTTSYTYDAVHRMLSQQQPDADGDLSTHDAPLTTFTYTPTGQLESTTDPLGRVSFTIYDALGRMLFTAQAGQNALASIAASNGSGNTTVTVRLLQHGLSTGDTIALTAGASGIPAGTYAITFIDANNFSILIPGIELPAATSVPIVISRFFTTNAYGNDTRLKSTADFANNTTSYAYDAAGNRNQVTSPDPDPTIPNDIPVTKYSYDRFGNLQSMISPRGNASATPGAFTTTYTYDALNRKITENAPDATVTQYTYDLDGRVLTTTDPRGLVSFNTYDALGRVTLAASGGATATLSVSAGIVTVTLHDHGFVHGDRVVLTRLDESGNAVLLGQYSVDTVLDADHFTFDADSAPSTAIVYATFTTSTYDSAGNVLSTTDARGNETDFTYDALNHKIAEFQPQVAVTTQTDAAQSVSTVSLQPETTYRYDSDGNLTSITDAFGHEFNDVTNRTTTYQYDNLNRKVAEILPTVDGIQPTTRYGYDPLGNLTYFIDARGNAALAADPTLTVSDLVSKHLDTTTYQYDSFNRKTMEIDADADGDSNTTGDSPTTTWTYDQLGNVLTIVSPRGNVSGANAAAYTTTYEYDHLNRRTKQTEPAADATGPEVTTYAYDVAGNLQSITDPRGNQTSYTYDELNRKITQQQPDADGDTVATPHDNPLTQYSYDPDSNLATTTDPLGHLTHTVYDRLNRPTSVASAVTFTSATIEADGLTVNVSLPGNTLSVGDEIQISGVTTIGGNLLNTPGVFRVASASSSAFTIMLATALAPQSINLFVGLSPSQTAYDTVGNVLSTTDPLGNVTSFVYDVLNRKTTQLLPADVMGIQPKTTYQYDVLNRLTVTTDPLGNAAGADPSLHQTTESYDSLGRKLAEFGPHAGNNASVNDRPGTRYQYDANGNLKESDQFIDAGNGYAATTFDYDHLNRKIAQHVPASDSDTAVTYYRYDVAGNVVAVVDPRAASPTDATFTATYEYDALNRKTKQTVPDADAAGHSATTTYFYDHNGNLTATIDALGNLPSSPTGGDWAHATQYVYDNLNRKILDVLPPDTASPASSPLPFNGRAITRTGYDNNGNVIYTIDALGNEPGELGATPTAAALAAYVAAHHHTTSYEYDALGRKVTEIDPDADGITDATEDVPVTTFDYDAHGRLIWTTTPGGNELAAASLMPPSPGATFTTRFAYDALGRKITEIDPDPDGPGGSKQSAVTRFIYDVLGNLTYTIDPQGNTELSATPSASDILTYAQTHRHTTATVYDNLSRKIEEDLAIPLSTDTIDAMPRTKYTSYDRRGLLLTQVDPANNQTTYVYDTAGHLKSDSTVTDQGPVERQYSYDLDGNLKTLLDRNGLYKVFQYDHLNRVTQEQWFQTDTSTTADKTIVSAYDVMGRLTSTSDSVSSISYVYDALGRETTCQSGGTAVTPSRPDITYTYTYYLNGQRHTATAAVNGLNNYTETYTYDDLDRTSSVTQASGGTATLKVTSSYDREGRLTDQQRYEDTTAAIHSHYDYDNAGRLTSLLHQFGTNGSTITSYTLTYDDPRGWMTAFDSSADGHADYFYDDNGQLTKADGSAARIGQETYSFDANGNRKTASAMAADSTARAYGVGKDNRINSDGNNTFTYDPEGNRTSRTSLFDIKTHTYEASAPAHPAVHATSNYDYRNRMTLMSVDVNESTGSGPDDIKTTTTSTIYRYDVADHRIGKDVTVTDNQGTTPAQTLEQYGYDGDQLSLVFRPTTPVPTGPSGWQLKERILETPGQPDRPLADVDAGGNITWLLPDHQGSIRTVVQGSSIRRVKFDAFGNIIGSHPEQQPLRFGYTGQEYDAETGLTYMNARYYDPLTGSFVSQDPEGFKAGDSNLYRYVGNSTPNRSDPTGESWLSDAGDWIDDNIFKPIDRGWHHWWKEVGKGLTNAGTALTDVFGPFDLDLAFVEVGWSDNGFKFGIRLPLYYGIMAGPEVTLQRRADGGVDSWSGGSVEVGFGQVLGGSVGFDGHGFSASAHEWFATENVGYQLNGHFNVGAGVALGAFGGDQGLGKYLAFNAGYSSESGSGSVGIGLQSDTGLGISESFTRANGQFSFSGSATADPFGAAKIVANQLAALNPPSLSSSQIGAAVGGAFFGPLGAYVGQQAGPLVASAASGGFVANSFIAAAAAATSAFSGDYRSQAGRAQTTGLLSNGQPLYADQGANVGDSVVDIRGRKMIVSGRLVSKYPPDVISAYETGNWDQATIDKVLLANKAALGNLSISIPLAQDDPVLDKAITYGARFADGQAEGEGLANWLNTQHVLEHDPSFEDQVYLDAHNIDLIISFNHTHSLSGFERGMIAGGAAAFGGALSVVGLGVAATPPAEVAPPDIPQVNVPSATGPEPIASPAADVSEPSPSAPAYPTILDAVRNEPPLLPSPAEATPPSAFSFAPNGANQGFSTLTPTTNWYSAASLPAEAEFNPVSNDVQTFSFNLPAPEGGPYWLTPTLDLQGMVRSNGQLVQDIADRADAWGIRNGLGNGPVAGTLKHGYAEDLLNRYQLMFGDRGLSTEVRYLGGKVWQPGMPLKGSVRLDVVEGPLSAPTAVYDYKFGGALLTPTRVGGIRTGANLGPNIPVVGVHP
jgi:RHS repeat-associated protein